MVLRKQLRMTAQLFATMPHLPDDETIEPKVTRGLIIQTCGELVLHVRHAAAERGECRLSKARVLPEQALRRLLRPAFDAPTKAELVVAK
jgi:hypothetical protein